MCTHQKARYVLFLPIAIKRKKKQKKKTADPDPDHLRGKHLPTSGTLVKNREKKLRGKEELTIADRSRLEKEVFAKRQQREIMGVSTIYLVHFKF